MNSVCRFLILITSIILTACDSNNESGSGSSSAVVASTSDSARDQYSLTRSISSREQDSLLQEQRSPAPKISRKVFDRIWDYDYLQMIPIRKRTVDPDTLTPENLIAYINDIWKPDVKLDFVKTKDKTLYVKIKDSYKLTEQMGTTGADHYISTTTFTLTELKGITHVNFDFEEGSHLSPGCFNRSYYYKRLEEYKKINAPQ